MLQNPSKVFMFLLRVSDVLNIIQRNISMQWALDNAKPQTWSSQNKWLLSALFQIGHLYQLPQAHEALLNMGKQECNSKMIERSTVNAVFGIEHGDCTTELTTVMDTCKRSSQQDQSILQQAVLTGLRELHAQMWGRVCAWSGKRTCGGQIHG